MIFCAYKLYCNELSAETNAPSENLSFFLSFLQKHSKFLSSCTQKGRGCWRTLEQRGMTDDQGESAVEESRMVQGAR